MVKQLVLVLVFIAVPAVAQKELQPVRPILDTQTAFDRAAIQLGMKSAFLQFLTDDAVIFSPEATNGKKFWSVRSDDPNSQLIRTISYADISASGLLGYTTGNWRIYQKGKSEGTALFGQYLTIWERQPDGSFRASLDIAVPHEKLTFAQTDKPVRSKQTRDVNKRGWSPADASMNFLRASMGSERLGGAYKKFAAEDVRLLRDGAAPIIGKKQVIEATGEYVSIEFPKNVKLFQSADMAYTWNPCRFDNSNEGLVAGNCLHIWKLRKKKWWIVVGVFAPVPNLTPPVLKTRSE